MAFKFEQLKVWQLAMELGEDINIIADQFPKKELYNLGSQIRRAADSIALNISEGSTGLTDPEQKRFLLIQIVLRLKWLRVYLKQSSENT